VPSRCIEACEIGKCQKNLARQAASDFFTFLRAEIDRGDDTALSPAQREEVQLLFIQRDEIITLLARSDPAAVDRLSDLYGLYRNSNF
jgi:hypothetical protein